jgi:tripartite-type tricarboxylate transporter receptor subunit TctC
VRLQRRALAGLAAALALPRAVGAAPRDTVDLLVPGAPGQAADRWARGMAPFLERAWPRQALVLRNMPGRGGQAAIAELALVPDRKVIGVLTAPLMLARAVETSEVSPLGRVRPVAALVEEPVVLVAAPGGPTTIDALRNAPPGSVIGTPPPGTGGHLAALRLSDRVGLPLLVFPSAAAARQAALGAHVAAAALTLPDVLTALTENKLVALGLAASRRSPLLPELPTLRESGLELLGATRRGFAVPPEAPLRWVAWLVDGLRSLAGDPDLAAHCAESGQVPRFVGPDAWTTLLARQDEELRRRWREEPWLPRRA